MDFLKRGSSIFHVAIRFIRATQQIWPILLSWIIGYNSPSIFVWSLSVLPLPPLFYVVTCAVVAFLALGYTFFRKKTQVRQQPLGQYSIIPRKTQYCHKLAKK